MDRIIEASKAPGSTLTILLLFDGEIQYFVILDMDDIPANIGLHLCDTLVFRVLNLPTYPGISLAEHHYLRVVESHVSQRSRSKKNSCPLGVCGCRDKPQDRL